MCKKATSLAANLMAAERPTLVSLMTATGVDAATQTSVLAAYDAAQEQLANWEPGDSTSATVIEALNAALAVVSALKNVIPADAIALLGVIIAGVDAVIAIVGGNSPATPEVDHEQAMTAAEAKIQENVPGFKLGWVAKARAWAGDEEVAATHYTHQWNSTVSASDPKYASLKVA